MCGAFRLADDGDDNGNAHKQYGHDGECAWATVDLDRMATPRVLPRAAPVD